MPVLLPPQATVRAWDSDPARPRTIVSVIDAASGTTAPGWQAAALQQRLVHGTSLREIELSSDRSSHPSRIRSGSTPLADDGPERAARASPVLGETAWLVRWTCRRNIGEHASDAGPPR